jgi:hypothetical protein
MKFKAADIPSITSSPSSTSHARAKDGIIGETVCGIVLLIALGVAFFLYRRRKNRQLQALAELSQPPVVIRSPLPIYSQGTGESSVPPATSVPFYGVVDHEPGLGMGRHTVELQADGNRQRW